MKRGKIFSKNRGDSAVIAVKKLLQILNVDVSDSHINENLRKHPDYPSVFSIRSFLQTINIESIGAKIPHSDLSRIPFPSIAYLESAESFITLIGCEDDKVKYIDYQQHVKSVDTETFLKNWQGIVILVEADERSGERNYNETIKEEKRKKHSSIFNLTLLFIFIVINLYIVIGRVEIMKLSLVLSFLDTVSFLLSILLLLKYYNFLHNKLQGIWNWEQNFINVNTECFLNNKKGNSYTNIFRPLEMALCSLVSMLSIYLSIYWNCESSVLLLVLILNLLIFPFSFVALYTQFYKVKLVAPFYLFLILLNWIKVFMIFNFLGDLSFIKMETSLILFLGSYLASYCFLSILKNFLVVTGKLSEKQKKLQEFQSLQNIHKLFPSIADKIEPSELAEEITIGDPTAEDFLLLVLDPYNAECGKLMVEFFELFNQCPHRTKGIIRFKLDNHGRRNFVENVLSYWLTEKEKVPELLNSWYFVDHYNFFKWVQKYPMKEDVNVQQRENLINFYWQCQQKVKFPSLFFINFHSIPPSLSIQDFKNQFYLK